MTEFSNVFQLSIPCCMYRINKTFYISLIQPSHRIKYLSKDYFDTVSVLIHLLSN